MNDQLNRLETKIDKLDDRLDKIDVTLASQHVSLAEHIRRTALLEVKSDAHDRHIAMVNGAFKLVTTIGVVAGIIEALIRYSK